MVGDERGEHGGEAGPLRPGEPKHRIAGQLRQVCKSPVRALMYFDFIQYLDKFQMQPLPGVRLVYVLVDCQSRELHESKSTELSPTCSVRQGLRCAIRISKFWNSHQDSAVDVASRLTAPSHWPSARWHARQRRNQLGRVCVDNQTTLVFCPFSNAPSSTKQGFQKTQKWSLSRLARSSL